MTFYTPKSHNLLRLAAVWPIKTKFQKRCFELLRAAYVKARYSPQYKIGGDELAWIQERIEILHTRVAEICEARIAVLRSGER